MIYSVQYMRGLAAILVVVSHTIHKISQISGYSDSWMKIGGAGVDLFFIISGFIMCHTTQTRDVTPASFMKARVIRILPLYWVLTLIALVVFIIRPELVNSSGGTTSILNSFTLFPGGTKYLIQNGWTLSYEFWFYIIFSIALIFGSSAKIRVVYVLIAALVITGFFVQVDHPLYEFATDFLMLEFLMGIAVFKYLQRYSSLRPLNFCFLVAGVLLMLISNFRGIQYHRAFDWGIPCAFIFLGVVSFEDKIRLGVATYYGRALKLMGDTSYSLYLVHPFSVAAMGLLLKKVGLQNNFLLCFIAIGGGAVLSGYLCYKYLEVPLSSYFKRKSRIRV